MIYIGLFGCKYLFFVFLFIYYFFHRIVYSKGLVLMLGQLLRPGNIVLFFTPAQKPVVQLGMIIAVWRGLKQPKLFAGETPISSCPAFRAIELGRGDSEAEWFCSSVSQVWPVRAEGLICLLDCERCASVEV